MELTANKFKEVSNNHNHLSVVSARTSILRQVVVNRNAEDDPVGVREPDFKRELAQDDEPDDGGTDSDDESDCRVITRSDTNEIPTAKEVGHHDNRELDGSIEQWSGSGPTSYIEE